MKILSALAALFLTTGVALAEPVKLTAVEISALLGGYTAVGLWGDTPYRQALYETGRTVYAEKGRPTSPGRWRVNAQQGLYESWWQQSGWSAHEVWRDSTVHFWRGGGKDRAEFTVELGDTLHFD